jgi:hypothetical protein
MLLSLLLAGSGLLGGLLWLLPEVGGVFFC